MPATHAAIRDVLRYLVASVGRHDADDAFREFVDGNPNPTDAWRMVGEFWEARGEVDRARNAYQNAANSAPQNESIHATLGRFQILHGQYEQGQASFERARSNVPHGQRGGIYRLEVEALVTAGRFREAREIARDAVAVAYLDRDYFYEVFARAELESGDPVRSQRMVDEIESANLPLGTVVRLLSETGYIEKAAELIDEEINAGDYVLGGDVLLSNPRIFSKCGSSACESDRLTGRAGMEASLRYGWDEVNQTLVDAYIRIIRQRRAGLRPKPSRRRSS